MIRDRPCLFESLHLDHYLLASPHTTHWQTTVIAALCSDERRGRRRGTFYREIQQIVQIQEAYEKTGLRHQGRLLKGCLQMILGTVFVPMSLSQSDINIWAPHISSCFKELSANRQRRCVCDATDVSGERHNRAKTVQAHFSYVFFVWVLVKTTKSNYSTYCVFGRTWYALWGTFIVH